MTKKESKYFPSLRDCVRERLINEMLGNVNLDNMTKILIIDKNSLAIISTSCSVTDLLGKQVSLIEQLELKRQP
jgi:hypothetical protein